MSSKTQAPNARAGTMFLDSSESEIVEAMKPVMTTGKRLAVDTWPNNARAAVAISFDVDNEFPMAGMLPSRVAAGSYGWFQALPRIHNMLDEEEVPASFYVPVGTAAVAPNVVPDILRSGRHEIGLHGWTHEQLLALEGRKEEQRLLSQQVEWYERTVGQAPRGFRASGGAITLDTIDLLLEAGIKYDSSIPGGDDCYELLNRGEPCGLVEVPYNWLLVDYLYFHVDEYYQGNLASPDDVYNVFLSEFEVAYDEGGLFMLLLHPHVIGRRSRLPVLRRIIQHAKKKGDVWFATMEQIADYVASRNGLRSDTTAKA